MTPEAINDGRSLAHVAIQCPTPFVICTMTVMLRQTPHPADAIETEAALARAFNAHWGGDFEAVDASEHLFARELFRMLLADIRSPSVESALRELNLASRWFNTRQGEVRVIHEQAGHGRGRGVFAFRQTDSDCVLQAPHTRNDVGTGLLTGAWMAHLDIRAAAWNTVSRRASPAADLARASRSYFIALTDAAIDVIGSPAIVQTHGYDREKRSTGAGRNSQVILSSGTDRPMGRTRNIARRLKRTLTGVKLYPLDIMELGATQNVIGRRVRQRGAGTFTHIELGRALREQLRAERAIALRVGQTLIQPD